VRPWAACTLQLPCEDGGVVQLQLAAAHFSISSRLKAEATPGGENGL
jgi:hypothetical protein